MFSNKIEFRFSSFLSKQRIIFASSLTYEGVGPISEWAGFWPGKFKVEHGVGQLQVIKPGLRKEDVMPVRDEELRELTTEFKVRKYQVNILVRLVLIFFANSMFLNHQAPANRWTLFSQCLSARIT